MGTKVIERIVAERSLHVVGDPDRRVRVLIGQPEPLDDDFVCFYQILGVGDEAIRHAVGVDAVQALELVVTRALPAWLARLGHEYPNLRWMDASVGDFGFDTGSADRT